MEISGVGRKYHEKELIESTVFDIFASIGLWSDGLESVRPCSRNVYKLTASDQCGHSCLG